ncbi:hypothetical protein ABWH92_05310 [Ahrensia marina]|uniref:hypothetical protein n=1 Tax=Ahrensia marina TaxID=1514904 RepID=UPI0035CFDD14
MDDIYDDLPDNPQLAFAKLESHYRQMAQDRIERSEQGGEIREYQLEYINQVIAAATACEIHELAAYEVPNDERDLWQYYTRLKRDVENLVIQIRIRGGRRNRRYSVALDGPQKERIHFYISQIREAVAASDISGDKKDAVFKKLAELGLEIDRDRTRFDRVADSIQKLGSLSKSTEQEVAAPWWRWVALFFGVVDEAKEREQQQSLPSPEERKKLEPPRRQLPQPNRSDDIDDDIPF